MAKTLTGARPNHGWDVVKDPQQRAQMQAKIKSERHRQRSRETGEARGVEARERKDQEPGRTQAARRPRQIQPSSKPAQKETVETEGLENAPENKPAVNRAATPKMKASQGRPTSETAAAKRRDTAGATPTPKHQEEQEGKDSRPDEPAQRIRNAEALRTAIEPQPFTKQSEPKPKIKHDKTPRQNPEEARQADRP